MTFSLVARCAETEQFGLAIASSSPAVAARCAYVRAQVGAVATQNVTDPMLGGLTLDLMQSGLSAAQAITEIQQRGAHMAYRQVLAVDGAGKTAIHSGENALGVWGQAQADNAAAGGNLLANETIPQAMVESFASGAGHLGDRLLTALRAGLHAGGEAGAIHSAGMKLADKLPWAVVDLRCDWAEDCPIDSLSKAWDIYKPQMEAYVQRALDPRAAPSYGVPGDE